MMFSCKIMRIALTTSAGLLLTGVGMIYLVSSVAADSGGISLVINTLGILCLLSAPILLLAILVLALLPGTRKSLSLCNH